MSVYFDHRNEMAVLGAFLQDSNTYPALADLTVDDFHGMENRLAFAAMSEMRARKLALDPVTVCAGKDPLTAEMLSAHLIDCSRCCPSTVTLPSNIRLLREMRQKRDLYTAAKNAMDALNRGEDADVAADTLRDKLRTVAACEDETLTAEDVARQTYDDLERRQHGEVTAIRTGLPDLDAVLGGLTNSEMIILGARPGVGKSALAMAIATFAAERGKRVLVCSREMSAIQYGQRMSSHYADVSVEKMRIGKLSGSEWASISDAANKICGLPMRFAFQTSTVEGLRRICQRQKDLYGLDLLCVDYLQLMGTAKDNDNEAVRLGYVSVGLKEIAMEYNVPVLALAQVNRQEGREDVMPTLKELKGSGNLEQDADVVIFLHHPESVKDKSLSAVDVPMYKGIEDRGRQYVLIKVAKQRQGAKAKFGVEFDPGNMTYTCIAR